MPRRTLAVCLGAVALLAIAGVALWQYRVALLTAAALRALERQDLGPARLVLDEADLHGLRAHGLSLRGGAIEIGILSAAYSPLGLLSSHLDRVEARGFVAALVLGESGIEAGGRPLLPEGGTGGWDIDVLTLPDARLSLEGHAGRVEATGSATLALAEGALRGSELSARVAATVAGAPRAATIAAARVALEPRGEGLRITLGQATVTPEDLPWTAQQVDGALVWEPGQTTAQLALGRLASTGQPPLVAPISLALTATAAGSRLDFALHAETLGKARLHMEAIGRHDRSSGTGSATLSLGPLTFHAGSLEPGDLLPAFADTVEEVEGPLSLDGSLSWRGAALAPALTLHLGGIGFVAQGVRLRDLRGDLKLSGLWPPATPPGQALTATIEGPGLPAAALRVEGQLASGPTLKVERTSLGVAGGEIAASPFAIDPAAPEFETTLAVDHVDLAEIARLLGVDGLSGTGELDGRIPIAVKAGEITVSGGRLAARAPGVLSYRPDTLPPEIAGASVDLALKALADFHYETLALALDRSAGGKGAVVLRLRGGNPDLMSGQPFALNIRVESNFDRLAGLAMLSLRSAQDLLRRAVRKDTR